MIVRAAWVERWGQGSAAFGFALWLLLLVFGLQDGAVGISLRLLSLAALVSIPLALALVRRPGDPGTRIYRFIQRLLPVAATLLALSFYLPVGALAALGAAPWAICTGAIAVYGLDRLRHGVVSRVDELCISAGLLLLPVGGIWLIMSRAGARPARLDSLLVLLVAVHFHYAGCLAPLLAGLSGRALEGAGAVVQRVYRFDVAAVVLGTPLLAAGFVFGSVLEVAALAVLVAGLLGLSILALTQIAPRMASIWARACLSISSISVVGSMILAAIYGLASVAGQPRPTIAQMALVHGTANGVGFILAGLLGWAIDRASSQRSQAPIC